MNVTVPLAGDALEGRRGVRGRAWNERLRRATVVVSAVGVAALSSESDG